MWVPIALPDESFYSRIVRSLTLTGMPVDKFLNTYFNRKRVSIHPYLTVGIGSIASLSRNEVECVINQQTLIKLFKYYQPKRSKEINNALMAGNCNAVLRACNLASFKETEILTVKYCPLCAKKDMYEHGVSYWHISHQIPGVESCSEHPVRLNRLVLPARIYIAPSFLPPHNMPADSSNKITSDFARFANTFIFNELAYSDFFDLTELRESLYKSGYLLTSGTIKNKKLTTDLKSLAAKLALPNDMLIPLQTAKTNYVYHLVNGKFAQHPFKHLLISFMLSANSEKNDRATLNIKAKESYQTECLELLKKGMPILQIHRKTGKSRCYIKQLALLNNIEIKKIPRTIDEFAIKKVLDLAYKGFHREYIANSLGISVGSVEQIISCDPGLVEKRKCYKFESKRRRCRLEIRRCIGRYPTAIKQEIKNQCYAAFHWLYRNDKYWLNNSLPPPQKNKFHRIIDWAERDITLAKRVADILVKTDDNISLSKLDKQIGGHGWLLKSKGKLPLTMNMINKFMTNN
ncbi:hypothetical protein GMES_2819 [Paraglaciecola mesophila KMM 241]|uniref:Uncharacterized protein n=1 Tax=Paraglaciecola mesophila KMM 241 TaxID=1128912 RepID=K6XWV7_9ALTE|nr:TnsD family Tn7-like transposition protein [Paraglaciecola mesophila]GAC25109.1 hypothetical protein GMES_2819 [Paraglaciecola mesophila KMM 241]